MAISLTQNTVSEGSLLGTVIGTLSSDILGLGTTWQILNDPTNGGFIIDGDLLVVLDGSLIDFETLSSIALQIEGTDATTATDSSIVSISVTDLNEILGTTGDDVITGTLGADLIQAGDGDDTVDGSFGDDVIEGGIGNDSLEGGFGSDQIDGGDGDDSLSGGAGNDTLTGGAGYNTLSGGTGDDILIGGDDGNNFNDHRGSDTITGGAGSDYVYAGFGRQEDTVTIDTQGGDDTVFFRTYNYTYSGAVDSPDIIMTGDGNDVIRAQSFDFTGISTTPVGSFSVDAGAGNDDVRAFSTSGGNVTVTLGAGADIYHVSATIHASATATIITDFSATEDRLGLGDVLEYITTGNFFGPQGDWDGVSNPFGTYLQLTQNGADSEFQVLVEIEGTDPVTFDPIYTYEFRTVAILQNVDAALLTSANFEPKVSADGSPLVGETIPGTSGDDVLLGTLGDDLIQAGDGNDTVDGSFGDDVIEGGIGNDSLEGGFGSDQIDGGDGGDFLSGGAGNDTLMGGAGYNTLRGGIGDDILIGGDDGNNFSDNRGSDTFTGGAGSDYVYAGFGRQEDTVTIDTKGGDDTVFFRTYNYTYSGAVDSPDIIMTGDGNDVIRAQSFDFTGISTTPVGSFSVDAGSGNDDVTASSSNGGTVTVTLGADADIFRVVPFANSTVIITDFSIAEDRIGLDQLLDYLTQGNSSVDWDGAQNPFDSGHLRLVQDGADTLLEIDNGWIDEVAQTDIDYRPVVRLQNVIVTQVNPSNFEPALTPVIDPSLNIITGTPGDDALIGTSGNDLIEGLDGADQIDGGAGDDILIGGTGQNRFVGGAGDDYIQGGSRAIATVDFDRARYTDATDGIDVTVGATTTVTSRDGSTGTDTLSFIDSVIGTDFADTYTVGTGVVTKFASNATEFEGGGGDDIITGNGNTRVAYTEATEGVTVDLEAGTASTKSGAAANVGNDTFTGVNAVRGSAHDDDLFGSSGNDRLRGEGGNDFIDGRGGIDRVEYLNAPGDVIVDLRGGAIGEGTAQDGHGTTDTLVGIENIQGSVAGNDQLYGDAGDNEIRGEGGSDFIDGGAGQDRLIGGFDDDNLTGGAGFDQFQYLGADGNDTITDFTLGEDVVRLGGGTGVTNFSELQVSDDGGGNAVISLLDGSTITLLGLGSGDIDSSHFQIDNFAFNNISGTDGPETILGTEGDDYIEGFAGNDTIDGLGGSDLILGGAGDDLITGGSGIDSFIFLGSDGDDTITDFTIGEDVLVFEDTVGVFSLADVVLSNDINGNAVVDYGTGTITLLGIDSADLTDSEISYIDTGAGNTAPEANPDFVPGATFNRYFFEQVGTGANGPEFQLFQFDGANAPLAVSGLTFTPIGAGENSAPPSVFDTGGAILIAAEDTTGAPQLWTLDPTTNTISQLTVEANAGVAGNISDTFTAFVNSVGELFFTVRDATADGVSGPGTGVFGVGNDGVFVAFSGFGFTGELLGGAFAEVNGATFFTTEGSFNGTSTNSDGGIFQLFPEGSVQRITDASLGEPTNLVGPDIDGQRYFFEQVGSGANGNEYQLYAFDGVSPPSLVSANVFTAIGGEVDSFPPGVFSTGTATYVAAEDTNGAPQLWALDTGTNSLTLVTSGQSGDVVNVLETFVSSNGDFYFSVNDGTLDGTEGIGAGIVRVQGDGTVTEFTGFGFTGEFWSGGFIELSGDVYFQTDGTYSAGPTEQNDGGIFRLEGDGTATRITDESLGEPTRFEQPYFENGKVFFFQQVGSGPNGAEYQLHSFDGINPPSLVAADLFTPIGRDIFDEDLPNIFSTGTATYLAAEDTTGAPQLWALDTFNDGLSLVTAGVSGNVVDSFQTFVSSAGDFYFTVTDGTLDGIEGPGTGVVWVQGDGTVTIFTGFDFTGEFSGGTFNEYNGEVFFQTDGTYTAGPTEENDGGVFRLEFDGTVTRVTNEALGEPTSIAGADILAPDPLIPEDQVVTIDVLANDFDPEGDPLTITEVTIDFVDGPIGTTLGTGTVSIVNNQVVFDPGTDFAALNEGESATVTLGYTIDDGFGGTSTSFVELVLTGAGGGAVNANPVVSAPVTAAANEDDASFVVDLLQNASDPDVGDVLSIANLSALPAGVTLNPDGTSLTVDPTNSAFEPLNNGDQNVINLTFDVVDGNGGVTPQTATITIDGVTAANTAPTVVDVIGTAGEDGPAVNVTLAGDDADADDTPATLTYAITTGPTLGIAAIVGNELTFDPTGAYDFLADGQSTDVVMSYEATDSHGAVSGTATVTVTVTGTNDDPVVGNVAITTAVAAGPVDITLDGTDADSDDDTFTLVYEIISGPAAGTADVVANLITFDPGAAFDGLGGGQSQDVTITYQARDQHGAISNTGTVTITVTGENTVPEFDFANSVLDGIIAEDDDPATFDGIVVGTDADANAVLGYSGDATGTYGGFDIDEVTGAWTYTLNTASPVVQALSDGDIVQDTFTVTITDEFDESVSDTVVVTILGVSSGVAIIGGQDTGSVLEDADPTTLTVGGTLTISDADPGEDEFVPATIAGTYGSLVIDALGGWTYSADNAQTAIQELPEGTTLTDTLTVASIDGTTHDVAITITGTNDVAVISGVDTGSVTEDAAPATLSIVGQLLVSDIDLGENAFQADTIAGSIGSLSIDAAGNWTYSADNTLDAVQELGDGESALDTFTVLSADGTSHSVVISVQGINDAPEEDDDAINADEDGPVVNVPTLAGLLALARDKDANANLTLTRINGVSFTIGDAIILASGALLIVQLDGSYAYNPNGAFESLPVGQSFADGFTYTVSDGTAEATGTVTVVVAGANDAPQFVTLVDTQIAENTQDVAIDVDATDVDAGASLTYAISGGADAALVLIDPLTGELTFVTPPDFEAPADANGDNIYEVEVSVSDGLETTMQSITLTVTDEPGLILTGTNVADALTGSEENDFLDGLGANDTLLGLGGEDTILGGAGNDFIDGGDGNDSLDGGSGTDQIFGGGGDDTIIIRGTEALNDTINAGSTGETLGDTIQVDGTAAVRLASFDAAASDIENWVGNSAGVEGTGLADTLDFSGLATATNVGTIDGQGGDDTIVGTSEDDVILGGIGADNIDGGAGSDTITGGSGIDIIVGGDGEDTIVFQGADALNDVIDAGVGNADTVSVTGVGAARLTGFDSNASGVEVWIGNNDGLAGLSGATTFDLSALNSISGLTYIDGAGGDDTLTGSAFSDDLRGGAGNDIIIGGGGDDRIQGGSGNDITSGGAGDDTFVISGIDAIGDSIDGGGDTDTIEATGDVTIGTFDAAASSIEHWVGNGGIINGTASTDTIDLSGLISATGIGGISVGSGNDIVTGSLAGDIIDGGRGDDFLDGGAGNDQITGGIGTDTIRGGSGDDTIFISRFDALLDDIDAGDTPDEIAGDTISVFGSESVILVGFDTNVNGIENWVGNGFGLQATSSDSLIDLSQLESVTGLAFVDGSRGNDILIGSRFSDELRGGANDDFLDGGEGDDRLEGGEGADRLEGGTGSDTYFFANNWGSDTIAGFSSGQDTIDLRGVNTVSSLGDLIIAEIGGEMTITHAGNSIVLEGVSAAQFDQATDILL
ncbi:MAG: VCBS domain-containing protein [Alphaproteobacteria bacterium]|nr:VCBS domain-containing protein [Alphaproteobacteria bacterium]